MYDEYSEDDESVRRGAPHTLQYISLGAMPCPLVQEYPDAPDVMPASSRACDQNGDEGMNGDDGVR